jgi:1-acyl-sn-glycerol-3-phosphate acyltransferase
MEKNELSDESIVEGQASTADAVESKAASKRSDKAARTADPEIEPIHDWIYYLMRWLFGVLFRIGGWKIHGRENVPRTGPVIIAPNHISYLDPPLVGCSAPRRVTTMGKSELFEMKIFGFKLLGFIIQHMATFPVRRGTADRRALRRAQQVLKAGEALVIFPEGTRSPDGNLGAGEIGMAMIAHAAKAPIVPVFLKGVEGSLSPLHEGFRLVKTEVWFGEPLRFAEEYARRGDKATLQAINNRVLQEIGRLRDRAYSTGERGNRNGK